MEEMISLFNIGKKFDRDFVKSQDLLFRILNFFSDKGFRRKEKFEALKDISFSISKGEVVGIVGKNGSGKSTLLRVIAGIYKPDSGTFKTKGEVVYLTGFGQGLRDKLTMRENIFLVGSIMGLSQEDIRKRFEDIVEFSDLREYIDTKVFKFSSGMINRLSFSIGIHCVLHKNPDILLIDEAISGGGGDIRFQKKSLDKIEELVKGGAAVLLVSHNLDQIRKYCNKAILLDNGKIEKIGNPDDIIEIYLHDALLSNIKNKDLIRY